MSLDPISAALDLGTAIVSRFKDPNQVQAGRDALEQMRTSGELQLLLAQLDINKTEAANPRVFVSGWRPSLAWICVTSFAYHFFAYPILAAIMPALKDVDAVSVGVLTSILLTLIGARSFDKFHEVDTK